MKTIIKGFLKRGSELSLHFKIKQDITFYFLPCKSGFFQQLTAITRQQKQQQQRWNGEHPATARPRTQQQNQEYRFLLFKKRADHRTSL